MRDYWSTLLERSRLARAQGVSADELARQMVFEWSWSEAERLIVNIDALYRELAGERSSQLPLAQMARMAKLFKYVKTHGERGRAAASAQQPNA